MVEVQDKLIPVEAHFTGACAGTAMFTLMPIRPEDDNVIMGVRFDDLFTGEFVACSFPHYLRGEKITFDETDVADFMRDTLLALRAIGQELAKLREEYSMTSNTARYNELRDPQGPIRTLERKRDALKTIYTLTFHDVMGFWPGELRDMGIS